MTRSGSQAGFSVSFWRINSTLLGPEPGVRSPPLLLALLCLLVVQGAAITQSALWALPLGGLLLVALATTVPLAPVVGVLLTLRVLTDGLPAGGSRYSTAVDLTGLIAVSFILLAAGLIARRQQGLRLAIGVGACVCFWTAIALHTHGVSTVSVREGVREASIAAIALVVLNARGALNIKTCTRIVQIAGVVAGAVALIQFVTHSGADVAGQIRSDGTFAHPNDAAVFFSIAAVASLWRYLDCTKSNLDVAFMVVYVAACVTTFSIAGVGALLVMFVAFGILRMSSLRLKIALIIGAVAIAAAFITAPVGTERIASESATNLSGEGGKAEATTSVEWRLQKWHRLLIEWEEAPIFGKGLGVTTTQFSAEHPFNSQLPHNEYLRYLVETGALGVVVILAALVYLFLRLKALGGASGRRNASALAAAVVLGLLANAVAANTLLYTPAAYAAVLLVASVCVLSPPSAGSGATGLEGSDG